LATNPDVLPASLAAQEATSAQRRVAAIACAAYGLLALALLPFALRDLPAIPQITGIYATAVFVADLCTFVLLAAQFRASGATWLWVLACAYLYSGLMALLHLLTFPGALIPAAPVLGGPQAVGWLYTFWTLGFVAWLFAALLTDVRTGALPTTACNIERALAGGVVAVVSVVALLLLVATAGIDWLPPAQLYGDRFSPLNISLDVFRGLLALAALGVLWRRRRGQTIVHLWLSLTLIAAAAGPLLTSLGGRRYTFGWYAGRASFAFASLVILLVLMAEFFRLQRGSPGRSRGWTARRNRCARRSSGASWRSKSSCTRKGWKRLASSPAALPTTSTTC